MATLTIHKKTGEQVEVTAEPVQVAAALHGSHSLNGIQLVPTQVDVTASINPANGLPYAQITPHRSGGCISPPPTRDFK